MFDWAAEEVLDEDLVGDFGVGVGVDVIVARPDTELAHLSTCAMIVGICHANVVEIEVTDVEIRIVHAYDEQRVRSS